MYSQNNEIVPLPLLGQVRAMPVQCSGIYLIRNKANGKFYIGSAKNMSLRFNVHRCELRSGKHKNALLQNAWNKYGEEAFEFSQLEIVEFSQLIPREQAYIDHFNPCDREVGYNINRTAKSRAGMKHTEESKRKMRQSQLGKKHRPQGPMSEERKRHLSMKIKGRHFHTEESKRRIGAAFKGRIFTVEHLKKLSASQKGKAKSEEQRKKISETLTGRQQSADTLAKRSASLKAKFATPEQKARRAHAMKQLWADPEFKRHRIALVIEARRKKREERKSVQSE